MPWCPHITILLAAGGASDATQTSISPRVSGQGRTVSCDQAMPLGPPRAEVERHSHAASCLHLCILLSPAEHLSGVPRDREGETLLFDIENLGRLFKAIGKMPREAVGSRNDTAEPWTHWTCALALDQR